MRSARQKSAGVSSRLCCAWFVGLVAESCLGLAIWQHYHTMSYANAAVLSKHRESCILWTFEWRVFNAMAKQHAIEGCSRGVYLYTLRTRSSWYYIGLWCVCRRLFYRSTGFSRRGGGAFHKLK